MADGVGGVGLALAVVQTRDGANLSQGAVDVGSTAGGGGGCGGLGSAGAEERTGGAGNRVGGGLVLDGGLGTGAGDEAEDAGERVGSVGIAGSRSRGRSSRGGGGGRGLGGTGLLGGGRGSGGRRGASGGRGGAGSRRSLEGLDTIVDLVSDTVDGLLGDALSNGGDLGDDGLAEGGGVGLLRLEGLDGNLGEAELVKSVLLALEGVHGVLDGGGQAARRLLQGQGILERELLAGVDVGGGLLDDLGEVVRGRQDRGPALRVGRDALDGGGELAEASLDGLERALNGRQVPLDNGGGCKAGGQEQGVEDDGGGAHIELRC